jgi:hypothetical protein
LAGEVQEEGQEVCGDIQDLHLVKQGQDEAAGCFQGRASRRCRRARLPSIFRSSVQGTPRGPRGRALEVLPELPPATLQGGTQPAVAQGGSGPQASLTARSPRAGPTRKDQGGDRDACVTRQSPPRYMSIALRRPCREVNAATGAAGRQDRTSPGRTRDRRQGGLPLRPIAGGGRRNMGDKAAAAWFACFFR